MVEESLRIRIFENTPTPEHFTSVIEPANVPAVFKGCVKNWRAFFLWNPSNGGLQYLLERFGSSIVEAMLSKSAPVFNGNIRSHERVQLPFSTFIGYCKIQGQYLGRDSSCPFESERLTDSDVEDFGEAPEQIYLAQVPIMNVENEERVQLETLREDIQTPAVLEPKRLVSINLWMNSSQTRSSTHYDPHHNLLCIVSGRKKVVLWPPSASPLLYPMSLYGEASNHSAVTLDIPDFSAHPRAALLMEFSQNVVLNAGDALFIPEGWFHQVDSDGLTIAVNFWWQSNLACSMLEHMDAYYLRILLRRLTDKQMNIILHKTASASVKSERRVIGQSNDGEAGEGERSFGANCEDKGSKENKLKEKLTLHELEPQTLKALHELVSLVHHHVNTCSLTEPEKSALTSASSDKHVYSKENLFCLKDDPVALVLWNLHPLNLHNVFLSMAQNFPRTLEGLILHLLSPVGAEVLTRKFEEMDQLIAEEDQQKFYQVFYGTFDDYSTAMDTILRGKESFARQAFRNVLDQYLGINLDTSPPPSV